MSVTLVTLGVYGFSEDGFFAALRECQVDTFCDVRARRGVRGRGYAFANHRRLVRRLEEMGIRYLHFPELAPNRSVRQCQHTTDRSQHSPKRSRERLAPEFVVRYKAECLARLDAADFMARLGTSVRVLALCCVEQNPKACHRSLLATWLGHELGCEPRHLWPSGTGR